MAQYMDPLIRSGAMWSCGRNAAFKPRRGLWSSGIGWVSVKLPRCPSSVGMGCLSREGNGTKEGVFSLPRIETGLLDDDRNGRLDRRR